MNKFVAFFRKLFGLKKSGFFGDGSDGKLKLSSDLYLTREMHFTSLEIPSGFKVITNGYRVYCSKSLIVGDCRRRGLFWKLLKNWRSCVNNDS